MTTLLYLYTAITRKQKEKTMYIEVTKSIFHDAFHSTRPEQFTYAGLNTLFDWLDGLWVHGEPNDCELDVIAICCDFSQYESIEDVLQAYNLENRDELERSTVVLECTDGTIIIQNF